MHATVQSRPVESSSCRRLTGYHYSKSRRSCTAYAASGSGELEKKEFLRERVEPMASFSRTSLYLR